MPSIFRDSNLSLEEIISSIRRDLEASAPHYGDVRIRCVATRHDMAMQNALCMITPFQRNHNTSKLPAIKYKNLYLLEEWLPVRELDSYILQTVKYHGLKLNDEIIELGTSFNINGWDYLPGDNAYFSMPGRLYQGRGSFVQTNQEPIVEFNSPVYLDIHQAIQEWIPIRDFNNGSDSRLGSILVFMPEQRAYFSDFSLTEEKLKILIRPDSGLPRDLQLKGVWQSAGKKHVFDQNVSSNEALIDINPYADSIDIFLVGPNNTLYDYRRENRFQHATHSRILKPLRDETSISEVILKSIASGEGQSIEFKPYIDLGHEKAQELIETTIAFANTSGGKILIGISDHCRILGIEKEISHTAHKSSRSEDQVLQDYVGRLRQKIVGALNRSIEIAITVAIVEEHKVLVITVPEGAQKPYAHFQTHDIFVRKGANNVRPNPDTELPNILPNKFNPGIR